MTKKSKSTVHQPHDKLVKRMLSNPATARDIFSLYLPEDVLAIVDLNHLSLQKDSFIDDEHRAYAVDLLYKTQFQGKEGYIWLLLEHQRKSDYWMPVRLFKYIGLIWDHIIKSSKSKLIPLVYPLIIYNGDQAYAHSLNLSDLIELDEAKAIFSTLFTKPFSLIDLPSIEDEALRKAAQDKVKGISLLVTLKHIYSRDLQLIFNQILIHLIKELDKTGETDEIVDIMYYILNEGKYLDNDQFLNVLHGTLSTETEAKIMTIAQQLEKKGEEKGIEIGIENVAKKLLADRKDLSEMDLIKWVNKMTGLSEEKIRELNKKH